MIKAVEVEANDNFEIIVSLENGDVLKMDLNYLKSMSGPVLDPLKDKKEFKKVFIRNGIVTWSTGYDIDPYYLVSQGLKINKTA